MPSLLLFSSRIDHRLCHRCPRGTGCVPGKGSVEGRSFVPGLLYPGRDASDLISLWLLQRRLRSQSNKGRPQACGIGGQVSLSYCSISTQHTEASRYSSRPALNKVPNYLRCCAHSSEFLFTLCSGLPTWEKVYPIMLCSSC